jgi:hypothetical protein
MASHDQISFITSNDEEIVLCDYDTTRSIWELWGRTGFEAPPVSFIDEKYADGYVETVAVKIEPREISINMIVYGSSDVTRDKTFHTLINKLIEHGSKNTWGKLKLSRSDGSFVYLNCIYSAGIEAITEQYLRFHKFTLTFHAADPYFYDFDETEFRFTEDVQTGLYFGDNFYLGALTYFIGAAPTAESIINDGQTTYPTITITGPAKNISITNSLSGKTLAMASSFELAVGEILFIDCRNRSRIIQKTDTSSVVTDVTNSLALGSSLVFPILTGTNDFLFEYTDTTAATTITFSFQKRYMSA